MPAKIENLLEHAIKQPNGCLHWKGRTRNGYGRVRRGGKSFSVHRLVFEENVRALRKGEVVRHRCNNPQCINPEHLEAGTQRDNVQDAVRTGTHHSVHFKGRAGEAHPMSKLSPAQVQQIRLLAESGQSHTQIATQFPVSRRQVSRIVSGTRWKGPENVAEALERAYEVT